MECNVLVLLAMAGMAIAGPITLQESDKCSDTCEPSVKLQYTPGTTYRYNYKVDTESNIAGASEDSAKLTIHTTADIEVLSACEFALKLTGTRLLHSDTTGTLRAAENEDTFRQAVESAVLMFSYHNGMVKHVCYGEDTPDAWVLNFKKGLLSSFQNSMDDISTSQNITETDVSGTCETQYKVLYGGFYSSTVKKTKDILTCTGRHSFNNMLQMSAYNVPSELQNAPIMKTTYECGQTIEKGGVIKSSDCKEIHVYRPFSNGNSGAQTTVVQTLTLENSQVGITKYPASTMTKTSLVYDHKEGSKKTRAEVEHHLQMICDTSNYDIRPESPSQFSELVRAMKSVSLTDLQDLHNMLKTKTLCSDNGKTLKFFHDALPVIANDASVKLMISLVANGEIKGVLAQAWITSLGFVKTPTSAMLFEAKALIDDEKTHEDAMLPVSSMVNNYCRKVTDCNADNTVLNLMASLEKNIGYECDASGKNFEKVLLTLRSIGNAGQASAGVGLFAKCLTLDSNPLEIRIAAAQAFRRMPCEHKNEELWNIYKNVELDSELRLAAYLSLMRCPTETVLSQMAASLEKEEDDHVGSFVYSHLTNLGSTSDPHRQDVAHAAKNLAFEKEFDTNPLKFSRNFEVSALLNKINMGFGAEGNVIWSSKSKMPRAISGNLTIDLFGQAINLMDFGGRLEGLEYLVKNLFGRTEGDKPMVNNVEASVYGRVFGNEMLFMHTKTVKSPFGKLPSTWMDLLVALSKKRDYTMTQSTQFMDISLKIPTIAGLPLNLHLNGTGTVDLVLNGQADLRKVGVSPRSMNIDGEIRPSAAVEITGSMVMDAMVTKIGLRQRNTLHTSTLLKGRILLEKGQLLNIELDTPLEKQEIFSAGNKFFILHNNMEQEQKMITENSRKYKVCSGDKLASLTGVELCGEVSYPNASMVLNSPYFPLTGPSSTSLTLHKRDSHNSYRILAKLIQNTENSFAQISLNTPGSKIDRVILLEMDVNYPKHTLDATMRTPWKKAAIRGASINNDKLKSLSGSLVIDDTDTYAFTGEVKIDNSESKLQLSPVVEVRRVGAKDIKLDGYVSIVKPFQAADIDMSLSGFSKLPYQVKTTLTNSKKDKSIQAMFSPDGKNEYTLEASSQLSVIEEKSTMASLKNMLQVNTPTKKLLFMEGNVDYREDKSLKLDGTLDVDRLLRKPARVQITLLSNAKERGVRYDVNAVVKSAGVSGQLDSSTYIKRSGMMSTKNSLDYTIPKVAKNKITFGAKLIDRSTAIYKKYTIKSNFDNAKSPENNLRLNVDIDHKDKHSEAEVELKYGPDPKDKTKRMLFSTYLSRKLATWENAILAFKMNVLAPAHNIDFSLTGKHQHTPKLLDSNMGLNYGKGKDIKAEVALQDKSSKLVNYNGKAVIAWPGNEYTLTSSMDQKSARQYAHTLDLKNNKGTKHSIATTYEMPSGNAHEFVTKLDCTGLKPITIMGSTNLDPNNFKLSGEIQNNKQSYGFKTHSKVTKTPRAMMTLEVFNPVRRMTLLVDAEQLKNKYTGKVEAAWDADGDKSQKIVMEGSTFVKSSEGFKSQGIDMSFNSPFKNFEDLVTSFKYGSDNSQHDLHGKVSWGGESITSSLNIKKPVSLKNFQVVAEVKTSFKEIRIISFDLDHSINSELKTTLKGRWNKDNGILAIEGVNAGDMNSRNLKGSLSFKSTLTLKNIKTVKFNFAHQDGSGLIVSNAAFILNGKPYSYDYNMAHSRDGWQIRNSGSLLVIVPNTKVDSKWSHTSNENDIKSTLSSNWGKKHLLIEIDGSHDLVESGTIGGQIKIDTPWSPLKDVDLSLNHKHRNGLWTKALMKQNGKTKASYAVEYTSGSSEISLALSLTSPYFKDFSAKVDSQYGKHPMTGLVEISWGPKEKVNVETSVNVIAWNDADIDFKVTLPSRQYNNIIFKASNKEQSDTILSHMSLDYGVRKSIDIESNFTYTDIKKMFRVKMKTPFEQVRFLDTGVFLSGEATNFDGKANFKLLPVIGKFEGNIKCIFNENPEGSIRLTTPFEDYPYFELAANSHKKELARQATITVKYHPSQVYRLDTTFTTQMPYSFKAKLRSHHPEYNNIGIAFQHDKQASKIVSHGSVQYQQDKNLEADLNLSWESNYEGSLKVKTPFKGYEVSRVILKHEGNMQEFSSRGQINVDENSFTAGASFNNKHHTTGTLSLTSTIPHLENLKFSINKKGDLNSLKTGAIFILNGNKSQANFQHKKSENNFKSMLSISSPYCEDFKVNMDHTGPLDSFTNKMSVNYGSHYDVDTMFAIDHKDSDFNGNGLIQAKFDGTKNVAQVTFKKTGLIKDMSLSGTASYNEDDIRVSGSWKIHDGVEGTVHVETPFENFGNIGATISQKGNDIYNFNIDTSLNYMEDKKINGKIEMSSDGLRRIKFDTELQTPFKNLESTNFLFEHDYDDDNLAMSGSAQLTSTIAEFGKGTISYTKSGDLNNFSAHVDANCAMNEAVLTVSKTGPWKDLIVSSIASLNGDAISMDGSFKCLDDINGKLNVKTPFDNYKNLELKFMHYGDITDFNFNTDTSLKYMDNKKIISKMTMSSNGLKKIRLDTELQTPFSNLESTTLSIKHDYDTDTLAMSGGAEITSTIGKFGHGNISYKKTGDLFNFNGQIDAKYAEDEAVLTFKKTGLLDNLAVSTGVRLNSDEINIEGSLKIHDNIDTQIHVKTPFQGYKNLAMKFSHHGDIKQFNFNTDASLNYMDNKNIIGKITMTSDGLNRVRFESEVQTPFRKVESTKLTVKHDYDVNTMAMSGGAELTTSIAEFGKGSISYTKSGDINNFIGQMDANYAENKAVISITKKGTLNKFNMSTSVSLNNEAISMDGSFNFLDGIAGLMNIKTPFENYRNLDLKLTHHGSINDFGSYISIDYRESKNINSKIEMSYKGAKRIKMSAEFITPSELLGASMLTFNHKYDVEKGTVSTKGLIKTDIANFGNADFKLKTTGNMYDLSLEGECTHNEKEIVNSKVTNTIQSHSLNTFVSLKSVFTSPFELTIARSGDILNSICKVRGTIDASNIVSLESSMSNEGDIFKGQYKLIVQTKDFGSHSGSLIIDKEGRIDNFKGSIQGIFNKDELLFTGALNTKGDIIGSLNIKTPFDGYENMGMSFTHSGNLEQFDTEGAITLSDSHHYSARVHFFRNMLKLIESTIEVNTPMKGYEFTKYQWRHESHEGSFNCYQTLEYGNGQKIIHELTATMSPHPRLTITLKTPFDNYEEMMAFGSLVNNWPIASLSAKVNPGNGKVFSVDGSLDMTNEISGYLTISTPVEHFSKIGLTLRQSGDMTNFASEGTITYMDNKQLAGKITFKQNGMRTKAELMTPFTGYEFNTFEFKKVDKKNGFSEESSLLFNNKMYKNTFKLTFGKKPEMLFTLKTPFEGYESMSASYSLDMVGKKISLDSSINAGKERSLSLSSGFDMNEDIIGFVTLKTPLNGYRDIGASFKHTGDAEKFQCVAKITYSDEKEVSGNFNFHRNMWRHLTASAVLNTPFHGLEITKGDITFENRNDTVTASSTLDLGDGKKLDGTVRVTYSPTYDLRLTADTFFPKMRNLIIVASTDLNAPTYVVTAGVTHNNKKAFSLNGKLNLPTVKSLGSFLEIKTPIQGLEFTKVEYEHTVNPLTVDGSASLTYGNEHRVYGAELKSTISPSIDANLVLKTPITGYSTIEGAIAYDCSDKKYEASSHLQVEDGRVFTMSSGLDYSVEPMSAFTKVSTPHSSFEDIELVLTHEGHIKKFRTTGFLASPLTDNVNAEASLDYDSPSHMSLSASMKSSLAGMDDLFFDLKTSDVSGGKKLNAIAGWTDKQQITADLTYHKTEAAESETNTIADMSLTTPFIALQSLVVQSEFTKKLDAAMEKLTVEIDGTRVLDHSGEWSFKDKHEAKIEFRQPVPMVYTGRFSNKDGNLEGDLFLNWNRAVTHSNVHLIATIKDKSDEQLIDRSVDVEVRGPEKNMGLSHVQQHSGSHLRSMGNVYWGSNHEDRVTYDLQMSKGSHNSMISDATLKLGLPTRTLQLTGSLSDSEVYRATDVSFFWDLDHDNSKHVGVKAKMTKGESVRGDITLSMPSIKKEIRIDGELMLDNGRVILDSKTDISYSSDSSKTLTLTSKLHDITNYKNAFYNYTVELGLSHPYTNIDMTLNSHIGSSDERMTMGLEARYLTAQKQTKNLALLAEINKLKKQINLQMSNPTKKVELVGVVIGTDPSRLKLLNRINNEEVFSSVLTVNTDQKSAEMNAIMGTDTFSLTALYPNNTAFQAYLSHSNPEIKQQDALLALRLNTSRLLHSRLAWRPHLWNELRAGIEGKMRNLGHDGVEMWATMKSEMADEFAGKYEAITTHLKDELTPIIDSLEEELRTIYNRMVEISEQLRTIYDNNDLYVQSMAEPYNAMLRRYESLVIEYQSTCNQVIQSWRQGLMDMTEFPAREEYLEFVETTMSSMADRVYPVLAILGDYTGKLQGALEGYKLRTQRMAKSIADHIQNTDYIGKVMDKVKEVKNIDISPYINRFDIPEEYSNTIDSAKEMAMSGFKFVWERPEIDMVTDKLNIIFQEGVWAYYYWDVEQNLKTNLDKTTNLMLDIVEVELREEAKEMTMDYFKYPMAVWDPEQGEIQTEIVLPMKVKRLDKVPNVNPLIRKAKKMARKVAVYLPDQSTWERIKKSASGMLSSVEETKNKLKGRLRRNRPNRKYRNKRGKKSKNM